MERVWPEKKNQAPKWLQDRGAEVVSLSRGEWGVAVHGQEWFAQNSKQAAIEMAQAHSGAGGPATQTETYDDLARHEL